MVRCFMIFGQIYEILATVKGQGQGLGPESVVILSTHLGGMENLGSSEPETEGVLVVMHKANIYTQWILACFYSKAPNKLVPGLFEH